METVLDMVTEILVQHNGDAIDAQQEESLFELLQDVCENEMADDVDKQGSIVKLTMQQANEASQCIVCLKEFASGNKVVKLRCGHYYDINCIESWLQVTDTCPVCRSKVTDQLYSHKIEMEGKSIYLEYALDGAIRSISMNLSGKNISLVNRSYVQDEGNTNNEN